MSAWAASALVASGGAIGALARYWTGVGVASLLGAGWPFATLAVNVLGSFAIGVVAATVPLGSPIHALMTVGVLGGFTTFSAFSLETVRLLQDGRAGSAALYVVLSVVLCTWAAFAGFTLVRALP